MSDNTKTILLWITFISIGVFVGWNLHAFQHKDLPANEVITPQEQTIKSKDSAQSKRFELMLDTNQLATRSINIQQRTQLAKRFKIKKQNEKDTTIIYSADYLETKRIADSLIRGKR